MPKKICLDCGRITDVSRCRPCQQAYDRVHNQRRAAKAKAHGQNTMACRKLRAAVIDRDGHACRQCGSTPYLTVHLDPALGGNHWQATIDDCIPLCPSHHGQVDAPRAARKRRS